MDIDAALVAELRAKAEEAERNINHIEVMSKNRDFPDGLDIPSLNELRYAFHHLLRYLSGDPDGAKDALKHVHRAIFDCYETESLYLFALFADFESGNQDILMRDVFPNYLACAREFSNLRDFVKCTRRDNRHDYYRQLEQMLVRVRPFVAEMSAVKQEILKLRAQREKERGDKDQTLIIAAENLAIARKTVTIRTVALVVTLLVGVGGVVAAVLLRG